jgi:hypothetical protein
MMDAVELKDRRYTMKQGIAATCGFLFILLTSPFLMAESSGESNPLCLTSFFTNSLHYTGEGIRRWYEEKGGFMELDWVFLNRTEKAWQPVPAESAPMVQFAAYGSPLTESQFRKLTQNESENKNIK